MKGLEKESANVREIEIDAAFSGGVNGVYERRRELKSRVGAVAEKIAELYCEEEYSLGLDEAVRLNDERRFAAQEMYWVMPVPLWQQVSGLYSKSHREMSPNERAGRIRKLLRRVERMMRVEMKRVTVHAGRHPGRQECLPHPVEAEDSQDGSVISETVFWSPVKTICAYLEISQRHLSALCKEITGMAIQEIVDRIKAERLRASFKERLKGFVSSWFGVAENRQKSVQRKRAEIADQIFAALKADRRGPRFHRTQWAMELGYSSYQRMFRAALLSEGLTPHQVEIEVIEELVPKEEDAVCVGGQNEPLPPAPSPFHGEGENVRREGAGRDAPSTAVP